MLFLSNVSSVRGVSESADGMCASGIGATTCEVARVYLMDMGGPLRDGELCGESLLSELDDTFPGLNMRVCGANVSRYGCVRSQPLTRRLS